MHRKGKLTLETGFYAAAMLLILLGTCVAAETSQPLVGTVGPTKIRFYTGNLSVGYFMGYWGTGEQGPGDVATREYCDQMKSVSVTASCDYIAWCRAEAEPGEWDWGFYDNNERVLHENGLQYSVFCWLHFPPRWFMATREYVPYRCVEHDKPIQQTSIWAPGTLKVFERFYRQLAAHFGDKIDFLRLAMPAEYGEIGYPSGMTNWLVKQDHVHPGFWCNDSFARAAFEERMRTRYRTIPALNRAWGTSFASFDELEFPAMAEDRSKLRNPLEMTPGERRWVLDFIGWYYDSQTEFAQKAIGIARTYFPDEEIIVSMGYASQLTVYGNDDVGVAKMCRDMRVACQTPGNIPYFCMKSLSSPCLFYGVPYYTEPPGSVNRDREVARIWSDASCGTQTYFDYPQNLLGARDIFAKYKDYLDGQPAVVDVAILFPTTDHRLRDEDWPKRTIVGANVLRELLDYDLVDERMIQDSALDRYKLLLAYDGNVMQVETLKHLGKWLKNGGVMLVRDFGPVETIDGDRSFHKRTFPRPKTGGTALTGVSVRDLLASSSKEVGKGCVVVAPAEEGDEEKFALLAADLAHDLSKYFPGKQDVPRLDQAIDCVSATLFPHRILYLNPSDKVIKKTVFLRESDFPAGGRTGRPERFECKLRLEPRSIVSVELH